MNISEGQTVFFLRIEVKLRVIYVPETSVLLNFHDIIN
jgi:hypothetical protein